MGGGWGWEWVLEMKKVMIINKACKREKAKQPLPLKHMNTSGVEPNRRESKHRGDKPDRRESKWRW